LACSIADDILDHSVTIANDSLTWVTQDYDPDSGHLRIRSIDETLYSGRTGLGLFFAALAHVTGEDRYEQAAIKTIRPLKQAVSEGDVGKYSIGGATGIGSMIYGEFEWVRSSNARS
jgi:lantibiotic modifying enzyme